MRFYGARALGVVALAVAAAAAALVGSAGAVQDTSPGTNGKIAFSRSLPDGNTEIYTISSLGGNEQQLTNSPGLDDDPAWRATGDELLFTSDRRGSPEIWRMTERGGSEAPLGLGTQVGSPSWSGTGRIAYESNAGAGYEIYATDNDGTPRNLTANGTVSDRAPEWSPDGKQIAFWSARTGNRDIYVMNADGSGVIRLTTGAGSDRDPTWSPDGRQIAFASSREGNEDIYVLERIGSNGNGLNLTKAPSSDEQEPAWSPDGKQIAFVSGRDGDDEIFVMNADGSNVRQVTKNTVPDRRPAWQPVGGLEIFPNAPAKGLTTGKVVIAIAGGTAISATTTILLCAGGNVVPVVGTAFFLACGLVVSITVEGGVLLGLVRSKGRYRSLSALRASPASAGVIAMPRAFAATPPTSAACKSLRDQSRCERLKIAIRGYQDALALEAAMSEGAATATLRYAAAGGNTTNQALQRAAAKVYWGQLELTTKRERAAAKVVADELRADGVSLSFSAAQVQKAAGDLEQLHGVSSSVLARLGSGGLTTSQIKNALTTAAGAVPGGTLDLQSFLRRGISTAAYHAEYRTLSIVEVGLVAESFRRQGIISPTVAAALAARLNAAKAAGSVSKRKALMRAFIADVKQKLTRQPYSSFLQSAAYPAAGGA